MGDAIDGAALSAALGRVAAYMATQRDYLTRLDAAVGDGDLGLTIAKGGSALHEYLAANEPGDDLGKFLIGMGMAFNRAASSTMGTLIATALMRAGKEARGQATLDAPTLARMAQAADVGIQERGKAKPGDKTVVDALHPAAEALAGEIARGEGLTAAGQAALAAARQGRDAVIPSRSKIGRAAWVGERTEGQPDPGTVLFVHILEVLLSEALSEPGSTG
ncbi:MAG: DAK2 domain-containing protein [Anaerolineales bacterium]|nr:DAK2 domain-containing protein [Anaerolineales bacterium]